MPGRAARDPLVAARTATTGRSPPPRSPRSSGSSSRTPRAQWQAKDVGVDRRSRRRSRCRSTSASHADGKGLWVNTFMDGKTRYFDLTEPRAAEADLREGHRQAGQHDLAELGRQARLHHLVAARQLGQGRRRQRAVRARASTGTARSSKPAFEVDFTKEKLGRAHHMKLGSKAMKTAYGLERTATLR